MSADKTGLRFEEENKLLQDLRGLLNQPTWEFDCPVCYGTDALVAELMEGKLKTAELRIERCACTKCGFVIPREASFLSDVVLETEIVKKKHQILKDFGIIRRQ